MELMAGARDVFVTCIAGIGSSLGSAGGDEPTESAVDIWATVREASSGGVEGEHKSITGCVTCGPLVSGGFHLDFPFNRLLLFE